MSVLLISPPFVQLNSPYASLPFIQGALKANGVDTKVLDLGIMAANIMFSADGLEKLYNRIRSDNISGDDADFFLKNYGRYVSSADKAVSFLKGKDPSFEKDILKGSLPAWKMTSSALSKDISGLNDHEYARYKASLYLEDIFLFYKAAYPDFGFSRYAEKIAQSPPHFDAVRKKVEANNDLISDMAEDILRSAALEKFDIIAFTIPFPGTLIGALKAAKFIKKNFPDKIIVLGGGYVNTELRQLSDAGIFDYADFICLDDGEIPMLSIIEYSQGKIGKDALIRTFYRDGNRVVFADNSILKIDINRGTPDYSGLDSDNYIPVIESVNPMMKLWSESNTLKLRLARGCYWHKCAFCDTSLPYVKDYSPEKIGDIVNDIIKITAQTGQTRFHFVDEALPPALLIKLSLELIRQNIKITWWGNIRFDKAFTADVCRLLSVAGCIAAVGGLESACDRTLKRMNKGVISADAVKVMGNFSSAGILVHAYMIYGFPKETDSDMIESAEILRQMFEAGIVQSAYWHRFALTVHSRVSSEPDKYGIRIKGHLHNAFANNDILYEDLNGNFPDRFNEGLKKAVYNWMLGIGTGETIRSWFDFKIPAPAARKDFVRSVLEATSPLPSFDKTLVWLGGKPVLKGKNFVIRNLNGETEYELPGKISSWLKDLLDSASVYSGISVKLSEAEKSFPAGSGITFKEFVCNEIWDELFEAGLLII
ncbi:MAG TPA: radical SAM protein [Clostridiales bacterium]|nr:radical SAM protein [Clostridiales bacterium]HQP70326.1 radical SAM protein [Clostridiales bacterium]